MKILYKTDQYSQQRQREKPAWVYPVHMAMQATYDRAQGHEVYWNKPGFFEDQTTFEVKEYDEIVTEPGRTDFLSLPIPDRVWTMAFDKRFQLYGNYKYHPATHMMVANGCWHGKCTFCVENKNKWLVRPVADAIQEVTQCIRLGFKEVFDDSGTFPDGDWLNSFCINKSADMRLWRIIMGCNMRIGARVDWDLMKFAGFRMVLFGIESANQSTLDRIKKGTKADEIIPTIKRASKAGLEPHVAAMVGFPWETDKECLKTIDTIKFLLVNGYAKTAQVSLYTPFGLEGNKKQHKYAKSIYHVVKSPLFWYNKIKDLKSLEDFKYLVKSIGKGFGGLWEEKG